MNIVEATPPNFEDIKRVLDPDKSFIFTYGDTIYCPSGNQRNITPDVLIHEEVHKRQQENPEKWWKKYLSDPVFRFEQELEAYRTQWEFIKRAVRDREMAYKMLVNIARHLSSSNYGNVIGFSDAMNKIKNI